MVPILVIIAAAIWAKIASDMYVACQIKAKSAGKSMTGIAPDDENLRRLVQVKKGLPQGLG